MNDSNWKFLSITPSLFNKFLEELTTELTGHEYEIYIDPELKSNKIIAKVEFIQVLKSILPSLYFRADKVDPRVGGSTSNINIDQFLNYRKEMKAIVVKINSYVRFTADGQLYIVDSIDEQKNKCIISKVGTSQKISIRVPLDMVVPTLKEDTAT